MYTSKREPTQAQIADLQNQIDLLKLGSVPEVPADNR